MKKACLSKEHMTELLLLAAGSIIYAASVVFVREVAVIPGSFLGIAVVINKLFSLPTGLVNLLLNIPVMVIVTRKLGLKVLIYTVFIMVVTSALIDLWTPVFPTSPLKNAYLTTAIGGLSMGLGAGMLIRAKGTMAGTTALTLLIQRAVKRLSFGTILFIVDGIIILAGTAVLGDWKAIVYSLLYSLCCARMMDVVIYFGHKKKVAAPAEEPRL